MLKPQEWLPDKVIAGNFIPKGSFAFLNLILIACIEP